MVIEDKSIEKAREKTLASTTWFKVPELAKQANVNTTAMEIQLSEWKASNEIFSVVDKGIELFPIYVFDAKNLKPMAVLAPILAVFLKKKNGWDIAFWFASANGFLAGDRPQNVLPVDS